jgi:antitoxin component HigA of HigAB toxin-antitoxin module
LEKTFSRSNPFARSRMRDKNSVLVSGSSGRNLVDVFGTPSIISEILNGKRKLTTEHIRKLSRRFDVSPEVFF